jgi:hypothetical protein
MLKYGILKNPKKIQKMERRAGQTVVCSRLEPLELAVWFFRSEEGRVGSWPPPEETGSVGHRVPGYVSEGRSGGYPTQLRSLG